MEILCNCGQAVYDEEIIEGVKRPSQESGNYCRSLAGTLLPGYGRVGGAHRPIVSKKHIPKQVAVIATTMVLILLVSRLLRTEASLLGTRKSWPPNRGWIGGFLRWGRVQQPLRL